MIRDLSHECEPWQIRDSPDGGKYCAACGRTQTGLDNQHNPRVVDALTRGCNICGVPPGQRCRNLRGLKLADGAIVHHYRANLPK